MANVPLVMTAQEWGRILAWGDTKEDPEAVRRRDYVKYLNETSRQMTIEWPNSLENVNKRNEELRQARMAVSEQANAKFYKRYVRRKKAEEERMLYSARDTIFKNKDVPKLLLSAVLESAALKEREEQRKMNAERKRKEIEKKQQDEEDIQKRAQEWHQMNVEREKLRFEVNKRHQKEIIEQAREISERRRNEREEEVRLSKEDAIAAANEAETIREFDRKFREDEKARIAADIKEAMESRAARVREYASLDALDDKLQTVIQRTQDRIECMRKQTVKEERAAMQRKMDAINAQVKCTDDERDAREQASYERGVADAMAAEDKRAKAKEEKETRIRAERIESRHQFLRQEAQKKQDADNVRQWELLNSFKNQELYAEFLEMLEERIKIRKREHHDNTKKYMNERAVREAAEKADLRKFCGEDAARKMRDADNQLLTHAAALVEEAKRHGRPTYPILKTIDRYNKMYHLYPETPLPKSLQEHFKDYSLWDGTQPDPWYRPAPRPPPDQGPDAAYDDEGGEPAPPAGTNTPPARAPLSDAAPAQATAVCEHVGEPASPVCRHDGLQKAKNVMNLLMMKNKEDEEKPPSDYRRAGPACGLQRQPLSMYLATLPYGRAAPTCCPCTKCME